MGELNRQYEIAEAKERWIRIDQASDRMKELEEMSNRLSVKLDELYKECREVWLTREAGNRMLEETRKEYRDLCRQEHE
jgi:uncharacterized coiled-coil DUF342 family protein